MVRIGPVRVVWMVALAGALLGASAHGATSRRGIGNVTTRHKVVALTFDDGPCPWIAPGFLKLFKDEGVKVTFFVIGRNVNKNPAMAKKMLAAGHELGNHTIDHSNLTKLKTDEEVREKITSTQEAVKKATGVEPKVFRAPYIAHDERTWRVLDALKLPSIAARLDTRDWDGKSTPASITDAATLKTRPGDIILMHEWNKKTLSAMPEIIKRLKSKGFRFVTVSELLAINKPKARGKSRR